MDLENGQFTSTFHGWVMFQPDLKSKLLQPLGVPTLLLKHVLFLQPTRMNYLAIITIMSFIDWCATATVGI